jgi:hypothetical protein
MRLGGHNFDKTDLLQRLINSELKPSYPFSKPLPLIHILMNLLLKTLSA